MLIHDIEKVFFDIMHAAYRTKKCNLNLKDLIIRIDLSTCHACQVYQNRGRLVADVLLPLEYTGHLFGVDDDVSVCRFYLTFVNCFCCIYRSNGDRNFGWSFACMFLTIE